MWDDSLATGAAAVTRSLSRNLTRTNSSWALFGRKQHEDTEGNRLLRQLTGGCFIFPVATRFWSADRG